MPTLKFVITAESEAASKAIQDFASDVGASVEDVAKKSKKSHDEQRSSLTELTQGYQSFRTFAVDAFEGVKKVWDFAKQGAEIDLARRKMDRLAESIGTTGEALRDKLGEATGGMLSNAEQIQMGTDLMSLGLAKTSDQVIRLSGVSSKLGMDMNQLVLTLANQTTMRFDQLGVSVDGFDEKLAKLKASGMSVNDAFTEAFLQQAEEQITKVGDATDTAAGKMKRAEAAINNVLDGLKEFAATGVAAGADIVEFPQKLSTAFSETARKMREDVISGKMSLTDYNNALRGMADAMSGPMGLGPAASRAAYDMYALTEAQKQNLIAMGQEDLATRMAAEATRTLQREQAQQTAELANASAAQDRYYASLAATAQAEQDAAQKEKEAAEAQAIYRGSVAETVGKIDSMAQSLARATDAQAKQMLAQASLDTLKKAYEGGKISQQDFQKATDGVLLRYELATPKSLAMAKAQDTLNKAFIDGNVPLDKYISASEKIPKLASDGEVSLHELAELGIKPTTEAVSKQADKVNDLTNAWSGVPRHVTTVYEVIVKGEPPTGATPGFATGADFIVPQGYSGDAFPMRVSSGERVIVQTPVQRAMSGGNVTVAPGAIVINGAGQNAQAIANAVMQELGRMTNGAINAGAGMMGM